VLAWHVTNHDRLAEGAVKSLLLAAVRPAHPSSFPTATPASDASSGAPRLALFITRICSWAWLIEQPQKFHEFRDKPQGFPVYLHYTLSLLVFIRPNLKVLAQSARSGLVSAFDIIGPLQLCGVS